MRPQTGLVSTQRTADKVKIAETDQSGIPVSRAIGGRTANNIEFQGTQTKAGRSVWDCLDCDFGRPLGGSSFVFDLSLSGAGQSLDGSFLHATFLGKGQVNSAFDRSIKDFKNLFCTAC
jgi:hypothetical protein